MPQTLLGPTSQSFISQRLRLNYVDWGNPDAPPLILVHGGRDHCRNWDWVAEDLRRDYHIIAPDLRGHGDSAWSTSGDYSLNAFVYDLARGLGAPGGTANVVAPGFVPDTEFWAGRLSNQSRRERAAQTLVGREGTPEEVASLISWLLGRDGGQPLSNRLAEFVPRQLDVEVRLQPLHGGLEPGLVREHEIV